MPRMRRQSFYDATARDRVAHLFDAGSFREFLPPTLKRVSPHLGHFNVPVEFDDGVIVGEAKVNGTAVLAFAQEGRFSGGALGEVHASKIVGLLRRAMRDKPAAVVGLLDSGGVRLQEANVGEIGATEIMRSAFDARAAGVRVIGLIGGVCGCFGGMGIASCCLDTLIASEHGRIGVSGPEVIETNVGVQEFDSRDKALVWRTTGAKNRLLFGIVSRLVEDHIPDFRGADRGAGHAGEAAGQRARAAGGAPGRVAAAARGVRQNARCPRNLEGDGRARPGLGAGNGSRRSDRTQSLARRPHVKLDAVLAALFPQGHQVTVDGPKVVGTATVDGRPVAVLGTTGGIMLGVTELVWLNEQFLRIMKTQAGLPIVMLVDNAGQKMALVDELLGLPQYIAALLQTQEVARRRGHVMVAVVYGNSVAGGFIAFGMLADVIVSLPDAQTSVMSLKAIARVTKQSLAKLEELARQIPVFAPGPENFYKAGGLHALWQDDFAKRLAAAIRDANRQDQRMAMGRERGGRQVAEQIVREVLDA